MWSGSSGYCRSRSAEASLALVVSAGRPSVFCAKREKIPLVCMPASRFLILSLSPFSPPSHSLSLFFDCTFLNQLLFESYRIFTSPRSGVEGRSTAEVALDVGVARWPSRRRGRHCECFNCCYSTLRRGVALKAL